MAGNNEELMDLGPTLTDVAEAIETGDELAPTTASEVPTTDRGHET